jgi:heptosyltransferase I
VKRIVFIRIDKIGDLISTLPVDQIPELKSVEKHWVIGKGLGFLPQHAEPKRNFLEVDPRNVQEAKSALLAYLQQIKPDAVISFYSPWWVGLVCWQAKIPLRVTRYSQWHSFLFFNKGLRQRRTLAEKHEVDYNLDLVLKALDIYQPKAGRQAPFLNLKVGIRRNLFERLQVSPLQYVVIHPGMAGSALNWPQTHYNQLIEKLIEKTIVVITGTEGDSPYLNEIKPRWQHHPKVRYVQSQLGLEELLVVLNSSSLVIAPSTGVAHLTASLDRPIFSIFSPIRTHHAKRWSPRGLRVSTLQPNVDCPAILKCQGSSCSFYPCMEKISVEDVFSKVELELNKN